jgi:hypothetical protein
MTQKEAYQEGLLRGFNLASWQEIPEVGTNVPKEIDWVGYEEVTEENRADVFLLFCSESESCDREYSAFEFTASSINKSRNPDATWEKYEQGLSDGFLRNWKQRIKALS